jgi:ABC-type polysaccharide/polyol phosphate export permease
MVMPKIFNHKKGIVFSIISVLIVLSFGLVVSFMVAETSSESDSSFVYKAQALNTYYSLLKSHYLPNTLRTSTRFALANIISYEVAERKFIPVDSLRDVYVNILEDGLYDGPLAITIDYSGNATQTFSYWQDFLKSRL